MNTKKKTAEINALRNNIRKEKRVADRSQRKEQQHALSLQRKNKVFRAFKDGTKANKAPDAKYDKAKYKKKTKDWPKTQLKTGTFEITQNKKNVQSDETIVTNAESKSSKPLVVDADLEARQHILALHVEYQVRR